MKQFILIFFALLFLGCEKPKEVYEMSIQTYVISHKEEHNGIYHNIYYIYFQTPTSTELAKVDAETYDKYQVGDTIQVLIKYWEKPKKK